MNKPLKILFNFPSRNRAERFKECLNILSQTVIDKENSHFFFKFYENDEQKKDYTSAFKSFKFNKQLSYSKDLSKVDAINKHIASIAPIFNWDIIINWSDDMIPQMVGFDYLIRAIFEQYFPDLDGCPCFWDGYRKDELITLAVLGRKYYDRFNYIYHPTYKSVYCDNEMTIVAGMLGKFKFINTPLIVKHEHYDNNKSIIRDEGYATTETFYKEDYNNFMLRKINNFDLNG